MRKKITKSFSHLKKEMSSEKIKFLFNQIEKDEIKAQKEFKMSSKILIH